MKKVLSLLLCSIVLLSAFVSCTEKNNQSDTGNGQNNGQYSISSSEAANEYGKLLEERAGEKLKGKYVLGVEADSAEYNISLEGYTDDGYIIKSVDGDTLIFGKGSDGLDRGVRYYVNYCLDKAEAGESVNITYGKGPKVKALSIAGNDISEYSIYLFNGADECHTYAAESLREYIGRACGFYPEIVREPVGAGGHMISLVQDKSGAHGDEAFTIAVKNGDLTITGGRYRGCMYGVFEFLESYVGYRFLFDYDLAWEVLSPGYENYDDTIIEYLYEADKIDVPEGTSDRQEPDFALRSIYNIRIYNEIEVSGYYVKLKNNGSSAGNDMPASPKYNLQYSESGAGVATHGIERNLRQQYSDKFGWKFGAEDQPCFANEEAIQIAIDYYTNYVETRVAAGQKIGEDLCVIDVSQNDNDNFCGCKDCRKYYRLDGSFIGPVLYFTNRIAEVFLEKYPGINVQMLAYGDSMPPPKETKPLKNIEVNFCLYNYAQEMMCYNHCISGDECTQGKISNKLHAQMLMDWSKLTDNIMLWYYPGTWAFESLVSYTADNVLSDMQYLKSLNIKGIFVCQNYNMSGDGLINYLLSRTMWNCDITDEEYEDMIREYYMIMYGDSDKYMYEYLKFQKNATPDDACWTTMGWSSPNGRIDFGYYADNFDMLCKLFDDAVAAAGSRLEEVRIKNLSFSMYYTLFISTYDSMYVNGSDSDRQLYKERWDKFISDVSKYGYQFEKVDYKFSNFPTDKADLSVNPGELFSTDIYKGWWELDPDFQKTWWG